MKVLESVWKLCILLLQFTVPVIKLVVVELVPLRGEMNLGHFHKTRFWSLLGVLWKFSDEHPRLFYRRVPPGSKPTVLLSYNGA